MDCQIFNKTILIFGGTGSLGNKLIELLSSHNNLIVYSRDENKHWEMSHLNNKIKFMIGDIRNLERVKESIQLYNPHIIIIASAMKHIDYCEFNVNEALLTNTIGVINVYNSVENLKNLNLETLVFISTDKATSPTNVYGMTKSLSERITVEYSKKPHLNHIKFVNCRYGNIINSRGSIIPKLQKTEEPYIYLTDDRMTRFIMTQEEATKLIQYSILHAKTGETVIPKIKSIKIKDLFELFSELRNKEIKYSKIRPGEKLHEELLNDEELRRTIERDNYYILLPSYTELNIINPVLSKYSSDNFLLLKSELSIYLLELGIIYFKNLNKKWTIDDCSVMVGVKSNDLAKPVIKNLNNVNTEIVVGENEINSFAKLFNTCISLSKNDIVIFCSHRVKLSNKDIETILERINKGFMITSLYRFACIAFHKTLIKKIGFLDEVFPIGGWEDVDFIIRTKLANIGYYEDESESVNYQVSESMWVHQKYNNDNIFNKKWKDKQINLSNANSFNVFYDKYNVNIKNEFVSCLPGVFTRLTWSQQFPYLK
jgi:dTDP-4-dehydrorhamnose reductase